MSNEAMDRCPRCGACEDEDDPTFQTITDVDPPETLCFSCFDDERTSGALAARARSYAAQHCRLTREDLPAYDPSAHFAPTPEEYEAGAREAHTPNAVRAAARHGCTNYDDLLREFERGDMTDDVYYRAINERIVELLVDAGLDDGDCE